MYKIGNSIITKNGNVIKRRVDYSLSFNVKGTHFPSDNRSDIQKADDSSILSYYEIRSNVDNVINIDLKDDSPVKVINIAKNTNFRIPQIKFNDNNETKENPIYGNVREVSIWFSLPEEISSIRIAYSYVYGVFTYNIKNFPKLRTLSLIWLRYLSSFPLDIIRVNLDSFILNSSLINFRMTSIPNFILNGSIVSIDMTNSLDLSGDSNTNGFDRIQNISNLQTLNLSNCNISDNLFSNDTLKNSKLLKTLNLTYNNISTVTKEISNCVSLEYLNIGGNSFIKFGEYLGNLINLNRISIVQSPNMEYIVGDEFKKLSKLKWMNCADSFKTQDDIDNYINSWFNFVINNASLNSVEYTSKFRGVTMILGIAGTFYNTNSYRPSGIYQKPENFIIGYDNGLPKTPMEKIYVLVNNYGWIVTVDDINDKTKIEKFNK